MTRDPYGLRLATEIKLVIDSDPSYQDLKTSKTRIRTGPSGSACTGSLSVRAAQHGELEAEASKFSLPSRAR